MDQLRQAFRQLGVTRETLAKSTIKESLGFLMTQTTLPKDVVVQYLKERFREYKEYPEETPVYRVFSAFSKSRRSEENFDVFLERNSSELKISKGVILLIRNEWGLKRLE